MQSEATLFYSDVCGFTAMVERLGDKGAFEVMQRHLAWLRSLAAGFDGREVEMRGDACLLGFATADAGFAFAVALQRALAAGRAADPERGLSLRVGLHTGRPISHANGFFGRDVILVARLADACPPNAILASRSFWRRLRDARRVGRERGLRLKGFSEPEPAARIYWGARERTRRFESVRFVLRTAAGGWARSD